MSAAVRRRASDGAHMRTSAPARPRPKPQALLDSLFNTEKSARLSIIFVICEGGGVCVCSSWRCLVQSDRVTYTRAPLTRHALSRTHARAWRRVGRVALAASWPRHQTPLIGRHTCGVAGPRVCGESSRSRVPRCVEAHRAYIYIVSRTRYCISHANFKYNPVAVGGGGRRAAAAGETGAPRPTTRGSARLTTDLSGRLSQSCHPSRGP